MRVILSNALNRDGMKPFAFMFLLHKRSDGALA